MNVCSGGCRGGPASTSGRTLGFTTTSSQPPRLWVAFRGRKHAPAAVAGVEPTQAVSKPAHKLRLPVREARLNWSRWELGLLRDALEKAEEEALQQDPEEAAALETLTGGSTASTEAAGASYSHWDNPAAHQALVRDRVLQAAWRDAFAAAGSDHLKDKVVLDLGCGPGLLAMMAAKAGARHVYAVDASEGAAEAARRVVKANGLQDRITVLTGTLPGISLPEDVDVIVSNWAGAGLLTGGMLGALAIARKQYLKPGGLVLPDQATLWAVGIEDREHLKDTKDEWARAAPGFDLSAVMAQVVRFPRRDVLVRKSQLVTEPAKVASWDMASITPAAVLQAEEGKGYYSAPLSLTAVRDERLFGLMLYFDLTWTFGGALEASGKAPIKFTTHPLAAATHYQQLVIDFPRSLRVAAGDAVSVTLSCAPGSPDPRDLDLSLGLEFQGAAASAQYRVDHAQEAALY